ncbi:MAG: DUF3488 domain-containing protein, partial [Acidobacteria bacterium]|nr:DUF3488 domain-containing protein [Acidobacteriota bacterium]
MSPSRDIHLLIGGLLLWSLAPFPFLYIVLPPFWLVAGAVGLWRIGFPEAVWRPSRMTLNIVAVVILLAVIAAGGLRVGPLRPLGHLLLLLTAVRVATVNDLKDLRRALPPVFLVCLVGVVSAVHVSIVPYLLGALVLWWYAGMRVFLLELSVESGEDLGRPRWRHAAVAAGVAALLTVPFFMLMPRLSSPLVGAALVRESGFPESVELGRRGEISESEAPALTLESSDGKAVPATWLRLRASAYDRLHGATWAPRKTGLSPPTLRDGLVWLDPRRQSIEGLRVVDIALEDRGRFLFLPPGAVALDIDEAIVIDPAGGVVLRARHGAPATYRVWVVSEEAPRMDRPEARDLRLQNPDLQTARLATRVGGDAESAETTAVAIESFLSSEYTYSLAGWVGASRDPVSWFLFESREGHCEFFAAAMVVMLRHEGVPARLVVGYHGGDASAGGARVVVRRSNAHTWVEAWLGADRGWVVFDPTPAEGVDGLTRLGLLDRGRLMWQAVEDFFDSRILTFGLGEQVGVLMAAGEAMAWVVDWALAAFRWWWIVVVGLISAFFVVPTARKWAPGVRRPPAARAVSRMAWKLARAGVEVPEWATIGWIGRASSTQWPPAALHVRSLVVLAEDELYGADRPGGAHSKDVRLTWR